MEVEVRCAACAAFVRLMNELAGTRYREEGPTLRNLHARHREYRESEVEAVIRRKAAAWLPDDRMRRYFRPSTLFRPGHFDEYLNEPEAPRPSGLDDWGRCDRCTGYGHGSEECTRR